MASEIRVNKINNRAGLGTITIADTGVVVNGIVTCTEVSGLNVLNIAGVSTFASTLDINGDIDIDGHTNLDNVSVAGVSTFSDTVRVGTGITFETNGQANFVGVTTFGNVVGGATTSVVVNRDLVLRDSWGYGNHIKFHWNTNTINFPSASLSNIARVPNLSFGDRTNNGNQVGIGDFLMYHDYYNMHMMHFGLGGLYLSNKNTVLAIRGANGSGQPQNSIQLDPGANQGVKLYHGGNLKFETAGIGASVYGTLAATGADINGDLTIPDSIIHSGDTNTKIRFPAADTFTVETSGAERFRIDSNGRTLFTRGGLTASRNVGTKTGEIQVANSGNSSAISIISYTNDVGGPHLVFGKSRAGNATGSTIVQSGDRLGEIAFCGADGTDIDSFGAAIKAHVDGTPGANDMPGRLEFYTTGDGGSSAVERLRIASSGNVHIGSGDPTIAKLQVSGAGFFGSANTTKTNDGVIIERNSGDGEAHITAGRSGGNYSGLQFYVAGASGVTKRYAIDYLSNFKWFAANGTTERAKITSDGYSKFTSDGTYDGYSNAAQAHEFRQSLNKPTLWCSNSSSAQTWDIIRAESARTGNSAFQFIVCTSGNLTDDEFRVRGDGNVYADSSFNPNGADYAEYFEWTDGNSSNEDRRGMTVVLDGNKIKVATSSDSTDSIIGVVSGNASVIGDSSWNKWSGKYQKDDYGTYLKDENGDRKLNPSFDDTKTYVSREDRQEWDAIGMVGKLRIRKGQITGTRWIKMRDISDTVEEWLVR